MDMTGGAKKMQNSLLTTASTGFAFEEAALLVPVSLEESQVPTLPSSSAGMASGPAEPTTEIDLNSDDNLARGITLIGANSSNVGMPSYPPLSNVTVVSTSPSSGGVMHGQGLVVTSPSSVGGILGPGQGFVNTTFTSPQSVGYHHPTTGVNLSMGHQQQYQVTTGNSSGTGLFFATSSEQHHRPQEMLMQPTNPPPTLLHNVTSLPQPYLQPQPHYPPPPSQFFIPSTTVAAFPNDSFQTHMPPSSHPHVTFDPMSSSAAPIQPLYPAPVFTNSMSESPVRPMVTTGSFATPPPPPHFVPPLSSESVPSPFAPPPLNAPPSNPAKAASPPPATQGNSFRLGSQKYAMYAKYPGLTGVSSPVQMEVGNEILSHPNNDSIYLPHIQSTPVMEPVVSSVQPPPHHHQEQYQQVLSGNALSTPMMSMSMSHSLSAPSFSSPPTQPSSAGQTFSSFAPPPTHQHQTQTHPFSPMSAGVDSFGRPLAVQQQTIMHSARPVTYHWFFRKDVDGRPMWRPFSMNDSAALEEAYVNNKTGLIATDGGRFDVDINTRFKIPVYWEDKSAEVRRCSWFYKGPLDSRFVPYEEDLSIRLEDEFSKGIMSGEWNRRLEFPGGEAIILYSPIAMSHFCKAAAADEWGNIPENQLRPRVVKRGAEEFEIEEGESTQVDHVVFLVHGIGAICDFKLRTIVEAVDDFRQLSFQLMQSHFKDSVESQRAGRIEFLPVAWHKALHGDGGIDSKLKPITLKSIPKLRNFTNDTLLDILFYTSPVYAQTIIGTVGSELNRLYKLFLSRNPTFNGKVALGGHSLGSLILFDLLAHQPGASTTKSEGSEEPVNPDEAQQDTESSPPTLPKTQSASKMVSYTVGSGTGQPFIKYPILDFEPTGFFALGSPIAMFVTVRGIDKLGEDFHFPTCPLFFNIFHPYDPVAYRIETLIDPIFDLRPVVIPHHKGRKRFHLELKETMQRVGADIKQKFLDSLKTTWNTMYQYATFSKTVNIEQEIDRVIQGEMSNDNQPIDTHSNGSGDEAEDVGLGRLNGGRRIDYVLQEAPLESFNEYLFALTSHVCYWESEDTMLLLMREIYATMGIVAQRPIEEQTSIKRSSTTNIYDSNGQGQTAYSSSTSTAFYSPSQPLMSGPDGGDASVQTPLFINPFATSHIAPSPEILAMPMSAPVPPPVIPSSGSPYSGKPAIIGSRPVVSPDSMNSLRGMDPTAPILASGAVGPPPLFGFQRK